MDKKTRQRNWYEKHRVRLIQERVLRKKSLRRWFRKLKSKLVCKLCGFGNPAALQFHHRESKEKSFEVSMGVLRGRSKESIRREMAKCDVLCANCHAIKHFGN